MGDREQSSSAFPKMDFRGRRTGNRQILQLAVGLSCPLMHVPLFAALMGAFVLVPAVLHQQPSPSPLLVSSSASFFPVVAAVTSLVGLVLLVVLSRYEPVPKMEQRMTLQFDHLRQCVARGHAVLPMVVRALREECVVL